MSVRSTGYGLRGPQGERGLTGPKGERGDNGVAGPNGPIGLTGTKGDAGPAGPQGPKGDAGPQGVKGDTGATGPAGAAAPTAGRLEFIANVPFTETLLLSLAVGMKRRTIPVPGVAVGDRLLFAPTAVPTSGCEVINVQPAGAGSLSVGYYTPVLALGASYNMPFALYRILQ